ncbi:MAG: putative baseplate assembly protein [Mycobacteriales bacterium]
MLPAPNLDDRRFQDLVDDARRLVQQRCPEWTDHNVSDPGITLIEAFATITDQLLYRLNRVPDLNYLKFLDLIGVRLFPPTAAHVPLTFWLSAPREEDVTVPAGTQVSTPRTDTDEAVVFTTTSDLDIIATKLHKVMVHAAGGQPGDRTDAVAAGEQVSTWSDVPQPGDALLIGLTEAVPGGAILLRMDCDVEGIGVDPRDPPLVWEAWDGEEWAACDLDRDETGGLNKPGDVVVHLPATHTVSVLGRHRAGWIRCKAVQAEPGQPAYSASPRLRALTAATIGGTVEAVHAEIAHDEVVGLSEGVPGQRFPLQHRPVVPARGPVVLEVAGGDGWEEWREVSSFAGSGPEDRHFVLDAVNGEIQLGPAVREEDGTLRQYGAVPPKAAPMRLPRYRTGGGRRGNVARGLLRVQRDPVPFVSRVENRYPATGGVDGETVADATVRGPLILRTRDRAVTAEDYEHLARQAAPDVARVRCVPVTEAGDGIRLLVVPAVPDDESGQLPFERLQPEPDTLERVSRELEERRCLGARIAVEPPLYQGITVVARLVARRRVNLDALRERALRGLYSYLHPLTGGPEGTGWPFGRPVQSGELYAVLQSLTGVELVEDVKLFAADPITGERGGAVDRVELEPHALAYSYGHQVRVGG